MTHVRRLQDGLLVAGLDGSVAPSSAHLWYSALTPNIHAQLNRHVRPPLSLGVAIPHPARSLQLLHYGSRPRCLGGRLCRGWRVACSPSSFSVVLTTPSIHAAGQDSRLRLWSLRTGSAIRTPIASSPSASLTSIPTSPLLRTFSEPVKALAFAPSDSSASRRADDGRSRVDLERSTGGRGRGGRGPVLWVGDGAGLECFEMGGAT